ncbi:type I pantothenate kinase [Bradyrhizobium sp. ISRA443]|uniref:type I pantothenate kinase n=1 Tax=unclassified Bradyrhizobium TaxID=2631580 RepID=UPI002478EDBB|nr:MULTISPECIES: type I pantothenate kinase [unclassified Bradyrhizobium]WGR95305.1 type I pantothenate kinase [Bradyrhizobium sp. ISRA435]WGS00276.1 type I pantothenate kinase [Bradyrhizobium sp. ISRA436]WGS07165.1 type I pantothenate kinase [Bradyrhizobium sp. ISRA437]WGS14050.1 type I pantothenate kinase [Bradyrhizobium sp. ISRA443]
MTHSDELSAYTTFGRSEWAALRSNTSLTLSDADLSALRGLNEPITSAEVADVYLPLTRLLNLHFLAARNLTRVKAEFLGRPGRGSPYIIALAGSVAVGKSTLARVLCALLARWVDHPRVELVTTDGFLHANSVLEERGLMRRKGFPESYDLPRMLRFLSAIKAAERDLELPVYSHLMGDIAPSERQVVRQPDILVFEGLNVLQARGTAPVVVSDFFDFSIYLDADEADIQSWYIERFLRLQRTAFRDPASYFHHYRDLPPNDAREVADRLWREHHRANLRENIQPTRTRADVVLRKRSDHSVGEVWLRET